jgi:hypothetical protein
LLAQIGAKNSDQRLHFRARIFWFLARLAQRRGWSKKYFDFRMF